MKKFPLISGSGVPQIKGILLGYFENSPISTIISKFIGGIVSIFSGLSLGCCGPSTQLGACVGEGISKKFRLDEKDRSTLMASGASAGIAAAFNAPISGIIFSIEELLGRFSPIIILALAASTLSSDFISKAVFGLEPVFNFSTQASIPFSKYWIVVLLGLSTGILGTFYNLILVTLQKLYKTLPFLNPVTRPIIPFIAAGILGLIFPIVLGTGHHLLPALNLSTPMSMVFVFLAIKFCFSIISFISGAPGGIFFPILVIGASIGGIFGKISISFFDLNPIFFNNIIILAMVGYFTAILRTPLTGIILIIETTGSLSNIPAMIIVSVISAVVANTLKSEPICTALLKAILKTQNHVVS